MEVSNLGEAFPGIRRGLNIYRPGGVTANRYHVEPVGTRKSMPTEKVSLWKEWGAHWARSLTDAEYNNLTVDELRNAIYDLEMMVVRRLDDGSLTIMTPDAMNYEEVDDGVEVSDDGKATVLVGEEPDDEEEDEEATA
jgi:hypothetical protein